MLLRLFPELIGLNRGDDVVAELRERLRTFPDRYAAKAPKGQEEKWRRVAENQVAEYLEMTDEELLRHRANSDLWEFKNN